MICRLSWNEALQKGKPDAQASAIKKVMADANKSVLKRKTRDLLVRFHLMSAEKTQNQNNTGEVSQNDNDDFQRPSF